MQFLIASVALVLRFSHVKKIKASRRQPLANSFATYCEFLSGVIITFLVGLSPYKMEQNILAIFVRRLSATSIDVASKPLTTTKHAPRSWIACSNWGRNLIGESSSNNRPRATSILARMISCSGEARVLTSSNVSWSIETKLCFREQDVLDIESRVSNFQTTVNSSHNSAWAWALFLPISQERENVPQIVFILFQSL